MDNFDRIFDRTKGNARKWAADVIKNKFHIDSNNDPIPMDLADIDFATAPAVAKAIIERAKVPDYSYTYIPDSCYEAIINFNAKRFHLNLDKEWLKLTYGTVSTLHYLVQALTKKGDAIMFHTPVYAPFYEAVVDNCRQAVFSPLQLINGQYSMNFEQMERDIIAKKVKVFILCNPQNPSGRIWTKKELWTLCDLCLRHKVIVISDEIHRDIVFDRHQFTSLFQAHLAIKENSILCCSPNKSFNLGGLKSSYIAIPNEKLRHKIYQHLKANAITSPNVFVVPALQAAYNNACQWLDEMVAYVAENHRFLEEYIAQNMPLWQVMKCNSSFLAWINGQAYFKNEEEMDHFFQYCNICIVKGSYFIDNADGWFRLSIGMPRNLLQKALERMKLAYDHHIK